MSDAEAAARAIEDGKRRAQMVGEVAYDLAVTDPGRARQLIDEALAEVRSIGEQEEDALGSLLFYLARLDPDRSERLAKSITDEERRYVTLADIAHSVASADEDRAERIVKSLPGRLWVKASTLCDLAERKLDSDPYKAAALLDEAAIEAMSITDAH